MIVNRNKRKKHILFITGILFILALFSDYKPLKAEPFIISEKMSKVNIDENIRYYEDKEGILCIDDIVAMPDSRFISKKGKHYNLGYSNSVFWFRIKVLNPDKTEKEWLIESKYPLIDYITAFIPGENGFEEIASGDRLPFNTMPFEYHNFIVPVKTGEGEHEIYFKVKSQGSLLVSLTAWDISSIIPRLYKELSSLWLFFGIMFALFFYNLFIFISSKDRTYLALTLFIINITIYIFIHTGLARKYLWPEMTWWGNHSHPFFLFLSISAILYFTTCFLSTKEYLKKIHRLIQLILYASMPFAIISLAMPYSTATRFSTIAAIIASFVLIFLTMIPMFFRNSRLALFYTLSWLLFPLGVSLLGLRSFGIIEDNFLTEWGYMLGISAGTIFLSIAVADKIKILQKEKESVLSSLRESEERYRLFFETAHDGILFLIDNTPVFANANMIKMTGYREELFYSKNLLDFFDSDSMSDKEAWNHIFNLSRGVILKKQFEVQMQKSGGDKIDVLISASSLLIGKSKGILLIITDITYLKEASRIIKEQYDKIQSQFQNLQTLNNELLAAQAELLDANIETEKEKEYLKATLSSVGDGVITYDMSGRVFLINSIAEELTGVSQEEATGKKIRDVVRLNDKTTNDILFNTLEKLEEKNGFNNIGIPFTMTDIHGTERIIELISSVIKLKGNPIGIIMILRDITVKHKIDNEIIKMSKLESIGLLAGGIAHDFNNLLTGISGNLSIAKNTSFLNNRLKEIIEDIEKATERAAALTRQLLTFATGGAPLITPYSIADLLKESVKFLIKDPVVKCSLIIDDNIKPALIDPNQISQAINNLLINSLQAMPNGGKIVIEAKNSEVEIKELEPGTEYIYIRISDNGSGIEEKNIKKIFDPFYTTKASGTGLGLSSTYSIIKKHKGYMKVISTRGEGTSFKIYLPASKEVAVKPQKNITQAKCNSNGSILIMDDEQYILQVFVKMLKHLGFNVDCAKNGEETIRLYMDKLKSGTKYSYVILDLTIPGGMGGKAAIKELLKIDPEINAIVSSGYSENPVMANYKKHGFKGVLKKPYTMEDIIELFGNLEN